MVLPLPWWGVGVQEEERDFHLVFRTFGTDIPEVGRFRTPPRRYYMESKNVSRTEVPWRTTRSS
jgi:hypothetical protein